MKMEIYGKLLSMITALSSIGFSQFTTNVASTTLSAKVSSTVGEFFSHLFLYPGQHFMAICIMAIVFIAIVVGTAYLIKKVYDKYGPDRAGN